VSGPAVAAPAAHDRAGPAGRHDAPPTHSIVIPVYRNLESLPAVLRAVEEIARETPGALEAVFVVDGSPDDSERWLLENLPRLPVASQVIALSRNFGSFAAIRVGLAEARGECVAVMAADLQEPPSLIVDFYRALAGGHDVALGTRAGRDDPWLGQSSARAFWRLYRLLVQPEMPKEGVDVFAVSRRARDALLALEESHSSLVAQLMWIGFPRAEVPYARLPRRHGASGWSLRKRANYLLDSVFSFTDIPIRILTAIGLVGTVAFLLAGAVLVVARLLGLIDVRGYTPIMITILFAASLIVFALGIVGNYVWRAYENTKQRPLGIVRARRAFPAAGSRREPGIG
jgi:glycosyltransferase involved in cell wall biosynthesis